MAAFTSVTSGNWNDGATWGNASPGAKGTDWPGNAGDTATISSGHTVTYNVSEGNALGQVDIAGILTFKIDGNTKLVLGNANLNVNGTGELRVGTDANPIGPSYTAEIYITPSGDNGKGLTVAVGAILSLVGSDTFGGVYTTYVTADWSSGQTFTVKGDVTSSWVVGQTIFVHRFRNTYQSGVDGGEFTIASMTPSGSDTDITISEAAPGVTYRAGGLVAHLTRNIIIGKASATRTMGNYNSNRPYISLAATSDNVSVAASKYVVFIGLNNIATTTVAKWDFTGCVVRNSYGAIGNPSSYRLYNSVLTDCIMISNNQPIRYMNGCIITRGAIIIVPNLISNAYGCLFDGTYFVNRLTGDNTWFQNCYNIACRSCDFVSTYSYLMNTIRYLQFVNCNFGKYKHSDNECPATYDIFTLTNNDCASFIGCDFSSGIPSFYSGFWGGFSDINICFDDLGGVLGDSRRYANGYATLSNATVVRGGGSSVSLEVWRLNDCNVPTLREPLFEWVEWDVPASAQTRKIYIRGGNGGAENWSTYPTATELYLEAEYYDEAGTTHKAFAVSTDVLTDNTTWTAFSLSFAPGRVGQVIYRLRLGLVAGVASKKLYVDPQLNS